MFGRLFLWLVCHDICPCALADRCRPTSRPDLGISNQLHNLCEWLDAKYFDHSDSVFLSHDPGEGGRLAGPEFLAALRRLGE